MNAFLRGVCASAVHQFCWITSIVLLGGMIPLGLEAQGLPTFHQLNPVVESRSGLYFQPFRPAKAGLSVDLGLNYGSAIELAVNRVNGDSVLLIDAEFMRINLGLRHDLGDRNYVAAELFAGGSYDGIFDKAINAYHSLFGIKFVEREHRPTNEFAYRVRAPDGQLLVRDKSALYFGDLRLTAGRRLRSNWQAELSVTLPTSTAPAGYGIGTVSANAMTAVRLPLGKHFVYQGTAGVGVTPTHGELSDWQHQLFVLATSGLSLRLGQRNSIFANLIVQSPDYVGSLARGLNNAEMDLDFGWVLTTRSGREWHISFTEEPQPSGPAIDLMLRAGVSW